MGAIRGLSFYSDSSPHGGQIVTVGIHLVSLLSEVPTVVSEATGLLLTGI
jgi:hypothetical protein